MQIIHDDMGNEFRFWVGMDKKLRIGIEGMEYEFSKDVPFLNNVRHLLKEVNIRGKY